MRAITIFLAGAAFGAGLALTVLQESTASAAPPPATVRQVMAVQAAANPAVLIPVAGVRAGDLRDDFGDARTGHTHGALDIRAPRGTPVLAAVDGTIRKLFFSQAGGITIYEFDESAEKVYYYAHLDRYADGLHEGQHVTRGTVIGFVGTTGNAPPDTPHLHFAIEMLPPTKEWWKGTAVNPYPILTGYDTRLRASVTSFAPGVSAKER